jgi:hypothetical protein
VWVGRPLIFGRHDAEQTRTRHLGSGTGDTGEIAPGLRSTHDPSQQLENTFEHVSSARFVRLLFYREGNVGKNLDICDGKPQDMFRRGKWVFHW